MTDKTKMLKENKDVVAEMFATMGNLTEVQKLMSSVYVKALADNNELRKLKNSNKMN